MIDDNYEKLKQLEKIGEEYFNMFGEMLLKGHSIQFALDTCYEYFYGGDEYVL